jgi:hypothetical protein
MKMNVKLKSKALVSSGIVLITLFAFFLIARDRERKVIIWSSNVPYSADPVESNYIAHQIAFRSILGTLVTKYKNGSITGLIAESWEKSSDSRNWKFKIRKGLKFSNGQSITAEKVFVSLKRSICALKKRNGKDRLFELVGESGLRYDTDQLEFMSKVPAEQLLDVISDGTYAIVDQSDFDAESCQWKNPKNVTSSGPYQLLNWAENEIALLKRDDFPHPDFHAKPIHQALIKWGKEDRDNADVLLAHSFSNYSEKEYDFYGGPLTGIAYVRCHSWKLKDSVCSNRQTMTSLRELFYTDMEKSGLAINRNFFPTASGQNHQYLNHDSCVSNNKEIRYLESVSGLNPYFAAYGKSLSKAAKMCSINSSSKRIDSKKVIFEKDPNLKKYEVDFSARATEIDFSSIKDELKTMFSSSDGLRLPDSDGRIHEILGKDRIDFDQLNQIIRDQALIWPLSHFSQGLLVKKNTFDFSQLNTMLPPIELQWVGWK